jgi:hypothetical protein
MSRGSYSDCDILGRRKEPIDEDAHERRIQPKLGEQISQEGICHTLWHDNGANGDALISLLTTCSTPSRGRLTSY